VRLKRPMRPWVEVCALSALCALWVEVCALSALCALWVEVCALSALCAISPLRIQFPDRSWRLMDLVARPRMRGDLVPGL
jgi:hypothetical protein